MRAKILLSIYRQNLLYNHQLTRYYLDTPWEGLLINIYNLIGFVTAKEIAQEIWDPKKCSKITFFQNQLKGPYCTK